MNFEKLRVTEREMLSKMMDYCNRILAHRRKNNKEYLNIATCISTNTNGVEIRYRNTNNVPVEKLLLVIKYDERNDYYYFLESIKVDNQYLEGRVMIANKNDFYVYFNQIVESTLL